MATAVYAVISDLAERANADWPVGVQDSYRKTKRLAERPDADIMPIGQQDCNGTVQLAYSSTPSNCGGS